MTPEQQTAATDNALEPVAWRYNDTVSGEVTYQQTKAFKHEYPWCNEVALYGPEAAERIKSLLAEVADLTEQRDRLYDDYGEALADRQRMREALEEAAIKVENDRTLWVPEWQMWLLDARQASKEANE